MVDDFRKECELARKDLESEREKRLLDITFVGDQCYCLFCAWCNAYKPEIIEGTKSQLDYSKMRKTSYVNSDYFREFCNEIKSFDQKLKDHFIKKYIAEKYLGFEYFIDNTGKEKMRKNKSYKRSQ